MNEQQKNKKVRFLLPLKEPNEIHYSRKNCHRVDLKLIAKDSFVRTLFIGFQRTLYTRGIGTFLVSAEVIDRYAIINIRIGN